MTALDTACARARASATRDAIALLATLGDGADPPQISGDDVRIVCTVPEAFLDAYSDWVTLYHAGGGTSAPGGRSAGAAWSGVLLPAQREAARLVYELFDGVSAVTPLLAGGYRLILTCDLARHDRLALCLASLPEVVALMAEAETDPDAPAPAAIDAEAVQPA